jgi:hypothetical protein
MIAGAARNGVNVGDDEPKSLSHAVRVRGSVSTDRAALWCCQSLGATPHSQAQRAQSIGGMAAEIVRS